jgi:alpha-beta hydrolase superfamily lysophospholipase
MICETQLVTSDGLSLYSWIRHLPDQPKGIIAIVHGMGEHSRRYDHLSEYWKDRGYASAGLDLRGHGRSEGKRGHTASYDYLMDDIAIFLDHVAKTCPGARLILYGHSMGGNLALNYAIRRQPTLAGLVVSAPYLRLAFDPPALKVRMAELLRGIVPSLSQRTGLDTRALSRDPQVKIRYEADPLVHDKITLSFFTQVHPAGEAIIGRASELTLPTLVMHGGADRLTSPAGAEDFVAKSSGKAELKIWKDFFHEIHNEPEWMDVAAFVVAWIENAETPQAKL